MKITILTIGKRHEPWVEPGIKRFLERLRAPFVAEMIIIPHSGQIGDRARQDESERLMSRLRPHDFIILLDERGRNLSSPELSQLILDHTDQHVVIIIGGAPRRFTGEPTSFGRYHAWYFRTSWCGSCSPSSCTAPKRSLAAVRIITTRVWRRLCSGLFIIPMASDNPHANVPRASRS